MHIRTPRRKSAQRDLAAWVEAPELWPCCAWADRIDDAIDELVEVIRERIRDSELAAVQPSVLIKALRLPVHDEALPTLLRDHARLDWYAQPTPDR